MRLGKQRYESKYLAIEHFNTNKGCEVRENTIRIKMYGNKGITHREKMEY